MVVGVGGNWVFSRSGRSFQDGGLTLTLTNAWTPLNTSHQSQMVPLAPDK